MKNVSLRGSLFFCVLSTRLSVCVSEKKDNLCALHQVGRFEEAV